MLMSDAELARRLDVARDVMRDAGAVALDYFRRRDELTVEFKGPQDVVSRADQEVEKLIRDRLGATFPADGFVGEEHEPTGTEDQCWVIDPIDGTQNFLRGIPYWSVLLAFVVDGRIELGLTFDPVHDELWTARRGHGTERNDKPVTCRQPGGAGEACVALSFGFKDDWQHYVDIQGQFLRRGFDMRRLGSSGLILAHISDGRLDVMYAPGNQSWDCLAGLLLVQEAGGAVNDFLAEQGLWGRGQVVAAVPPVQQQVAEVTGARFS